MYFKEIEKVPQVSNILERNWWIEIQRKINLHNTHLEADRLFISFEKNGTFIHAPNHVMEHDSAERNTMNTVVSGFLRRFQKVCKAILKFELWKIAKYLKKEIICRAKRDPKKIM